MLIKHITIKNFKSFGNNTQRISFKIDKGELILLTGENGAGKSSFQEAFDFSLFGIVRGKKAKKIPLNALPNRTNKNTEVEIKFINNFENDIKLIKSLEPTSAKFFENDNDESKRFKSISNEEREKIVGFNFETYKSFVSMSVSDFANFINLTPDNKRKIVNKLFNIQELDDYLSIVKDIIKNDLDNIKKIEIIIKANISTISNYKQNIRNIKLSGVIDKEKEITILRKEIHDKKEPYIKLKTKNEKLITDIHKNVMILNDYENQKSIFSQEILELKMELNNIKEKIKVYNTGTCPICDTKLDDTDHKHNLIEIEKKEKDILKLLENKTSKLNDLTLKIIQISNQKDTKTREKSNNTIAYNNLVYEIKIIQKKIIKLKEKEDYISIEEIEKSITQLEKENSIHQSKIDKFEKNIKIYEQLKDIFSTTGIRKSIIKNIVTPLNVHLKDILDNLNSTYNVKLDDNFNVTIYEKLRNKINTETLSVGEAKKINVAIALSYLKLILKVKKLNVLFLDEIFSSMQPKNVELALNVLKSFVEEYKINIIIVDPEVYFNENSVLGLDKFDRILSTSKKMGFSFIEDYRPNK